MGVTFLGTRYESRSRFRVALMQLEWDDNAAFAFQTFANMGLANTTLMDEEAKVNRACSRSHRIEYLTYIIKRHYFSQTTLAALKERAK